MALPATICYNADMASFQGVLLKSSFPFAVEWFDIEQMPSSMVMQPFFFTMIFPAKFCKACCRQPLAKTVSHSSRQILLIGDIYIKVASFKFL